MAMRWFNKGKKEAGWLALGFYSDHVDLVHVKRTPNGRPEITLCDSYRKEGSDVDTLSRLRAEIKLDRFHCTTLLTSDEYQLHQLDAPNVPAAELKAAMRWRLKDVIDYPLEAATIDVLDIPSDRNAAARNHQAYAIAARNSVIEARVKPFNDAEVPLEAIDIPDLAQRNISVLFESGGRGIAMLAFNQGVGLLTFTSGGELYQLRRIDITLTQLMEAGDEQRTQLFERVALELQRSLDHFDRQYSNVPIAKLLLAPLPQDIGLAQYLASNLYLQVEAIDLSSVIDFPAIPELKHPERQAQCLLTIGAALRDEEKAAA